MGKVSSLRTGGKKGSVTVIEYKLLVAATNNFEEDNVLGGGGCGQVYKARFSDQQLAAVKKLQGGGSETATEFEVLNIKCRSKKKVFPVCELRSFMFCEFCKISLNYF